MVLNPRCTLISNKALWKIPKCRLHAPQTSESLVPGSRHREFSKAPRVNSNTQSRLRTSTFEELVANGVETCRVDKAVSCSHGVSASTTF